MCDVGKRLMRTRVNARGEQLECNGFRIEDTKSLPNDFAVGELLDALRKPHAESGSGGITVAQTEQHSFARWKNLWGSAIMITTSSRGLQVTYRHRIVLESL